MSYQVFISERAEKNLEQIFLYLENEWSAKVKNKFKNKLRQNIETVKNNPFAFPVSKIKNVISKVYYYKT